MNPQNLKKLNSILQLALEIEKESSDQSFSDSKLKELTVLFESLSTETTELKKISESPKHFSKNMTLRHFSNLIIPIERALGRAVKDDDFLTTTADFKNKNIQRREIFFILDNIRSAFNVGSLIRLADCVGVREIGICGYTPHSSQAAVKKTSLSATEFIQEKYFDEVAHAMTYYKSKGAKIIALETTKNCKSIYETPLLGPTAFVIGNERFGLDHSVLQQADEVRNIPMFGIKNSLNVAQATAVAAFEWSRQNP